MPEVTEKQWETMYSRNIGKMVGICYRYTADRQLAEDLAHDAFLKAIDKAGSFEGRGHFDAWLRKIVVNHALQYIRDRKRSRQATNQLQRAGSAVHTDDLHEDPSPLSQAEFSEPELREAINTLPEHHRLVFNLYVIDNFTHRQIGQELGISEGTSKSHLARARKKLRQILAEKADKKQDRKSALLLFLFPRHVDSLYHTYFDGLPILAPQAIVAWSAATIAVTVSVTLTAIFITPQQPAASNRSHAGLTQEFPNPYKAPALTDSTTATISLNRIIPNKNTKHTGMKKKDSLRLLLLASSSILFDTTAQATHEKIALATAVQPAATDTDLTKPIDTIPPLRKTNHITATKTKQQKGTFTASNLVWSSKDHELYFKGVVRVDVGDNDFKGDGSFTFLGRVYLVVVNDTLVPYDSTINLNKQRHSLITLDESEATKKYGERGHHGAVEISTAD